MPIAEMFDYIQLINQQAEEEAAAAAPTKREPNETPTLSDVYRGNIDF